MASIATSGVREPFFEELILLTQLVLDAAMTSSREGGRRVSVADTCM